MVPPNYVKIIVCKISADIKKIGTLAGAVQKIDFWATILGDFRRNGPKKFRETEWRLQLNNFTQKLDFNVLSFRIRRAYKI